MGDKYTPRLRTKYDAEIAKAMQEKFGYKNALEIPRIEKITLNMGVGEASQDKKKVQTAAAEMELIAGQKPVITKAKKSIAQFKLREGMPIGWPEGADHLPRDQLRSDRQGARHGHHRHHLRQDRRRGT